MPRQARLDAPGTLHHVIGRGIERSEIFRNDFDRADFLNRIEDLSLEGSWIIGAWRLYPTISICWPEQESKGSKSMRKQVVEARKLFC